MKTIIVVLLFLLSSSLFASDSKFTIGLDVSYWWDHAESSTPDRSFPGMQVEEGGSINPNFKNEYFLGLTPIIQYRISKKITISSAFGFYSHTSLFGGNTRTVYGTTGRPDTNQNDGANVGGGTDYDRNPNRWYDDIEFWFNPSIEYKYSNLFSTVLSLRYHRLRDYLDFRNNTYIDFYGKYWIRKNLNLLFGLENHRVYGLNQKDQYFNEFYLDNEPLSVQGQPSSISKTGLLLGCGIEFPLQHNLDLAGNARVSTVGANSLITDIGLRYHF